MSRTPDERLYGSGTHDSFAFTQCYVSLGDPDGEDFAFTKCDADGNFNFTGIPRATGRSPCSTSGTIRSWTASRRLSDWPATAAQSGPGRSCHHQWQANIYTRTFIDMNGDGVST